MSSQGHGKNWDFSKPASKRIYGLVDPKTIEQQKQIQARQKVAASARQYTIETTSGSGGQSTQTNLLSLMYPVSSGSDHRRLSEQSESFSQSYYQQQTPSAPIQELIKRRQDLVNQYNTSPNNYLVQLALQDCESQISQWAAMNKQPGVFYGSTDAPVGNRRDRSLCSVPKPEGISRKEFNKNQPWLTKNSLKAGSRISTGIGRSLLHRMGWREGFGLGRVAGGQAEPVIPENFRGVDRRGLAAEGETPSSTVTLRKPQAGKSAVHPLSGKHPVSALMELCAKNSLPAPDFVEVLADGPSHRPRFIVKVCVQGVEYKPSHPSITKKEAKAAAAVVCLKALGVWEGDQITTEISTPIDDQPTNAPVSSST